MKRKILQMGMISLVLAFGMMMIGCPQPTSEEDAFVSSTNNATANNEATLGLIGTTATSSAPSVATVISPLTGKIVITSVSEGTTTITVSDGSESKATIEVTVDATGEIEIVNIEKYDPEGDPGDSLPPPIGTNELSGKTVSMGTMKIEFNADASFSMFATIENDENVLYQTGFYSWNATKDEVITVIEKMNLKYAIGTEDSTLLTKAEAIAAYLKLFNDDPQKFDSSLQEMTEEELKEYAATAMGSLFYQTTMHYTLDDGEVTYFGIFEQLIDTGTTISDLPYSEKAVTNSNGTHYLLSISFEEALSALTEEYGEPQDEWHLQDNSNLSESRTNAWVILELSPFGDIRLHKYNPDSLEENQVTTKGWN